MSTGNRKDQAPADGNARIDEYVAKLDPALRQLAVELRVIDDSLPNLSGTVWHGHPVWSMEPGPASNPVCFLKAYPTYVTFGLWKGQSVTDPSGRLQAGSRQMANVKLRTVEDVDAELFGDWLRQACSQSE